MLAVCPTCAARNRIPPRHLADTGRCGRCQTALPPRATPIEIGSIADFDALVTGATVPVLVDFWAAWCGPCRQVAPEVVRAAATLAGRAVVAKVDTEAVPALAARYRITGIPAFRIFRGGQLVVERAGAVPAAELVRWATSA